MANSSTEFSISSDFSIASDSLRFTTVDGQFVFIQVGPRAYKRRRMFVVTPAEYEPPGFQAASTDNFNFALDGEPMNIKVGDVATVKLADHRQCRR